MYLCKPTSMISNLTFKYLKTYANDIANEKTHNSSWRIGRDCEHVVTLVILVEKIYKIN